jgi:hypothetical protein
MVIVSEATGLLSPLDLARCQVGTAGGRAVGGNSRVADLVPFETLCSSAELNEPLSDALLLHLRELFLAVNEVLLAVSARFVGDQHARSSRGDPCHRLDRASQLSQLLSDTGNVLFGRHVSPGPAILATDAPL